MASRADSFLARSTFTNTRKTVTSFIMVVNTEAVKAEQKLHAENNNSCFSWFRYVCLNVILYWVHVPRPFPGPAELSQIDSV